MYACTFTVAQVRAAEQPLLDAQTSPDELMQQAAHAVAQVARAMVEPGSRVLAVAGPGGNGGDALYAAAELAMSGYRVDALLVAGRAQERALAALRNAGGTVVERVDCAYDLAIDGMTGIGGTAGLRAEYAEVVEALRDTRVLAVDVPSGIDADTGEGGELHVTADATVTFGGFRRAHVLSAACGVQLIADIGIGGRHLYETLVDTLPLWSADGPPLLTANRAVAPDFPVPEGMRTLTPAPVPSVEPGARDDKYSGGVVGIRAGSSTYPGAALLCTAGAVNATPAMVRYAGPQAAEVVRAHPEVVVADSVDASGRVQAWVFGPGAGTGEGETEELRALLSAPEPLLLDADALTLLATHPDLLSALRERDAYTALTPHDGEFARLREAAGIAADSRMEETLALATHLACDVLRKGRATLISDGHLVYGLDAGHSWAATPGSGDVLAGIAGAHLARRAETSSLISAATVHAAAAKLAAATEYGDATAPASRIAAFVREATALLTTTTLEANNA